MSPVELSDWIDDHPLPSVMGLCVDEAMLDLANRGIVQAELINGILTFQLTDKASQWKKKK